MSDPWAGAVCTSTDPEIFFEKADERRAVKVCTSCPIKNFCADYAIKNEIVDGVWGGLTEADRARIRSNKNQSRKSKPNKKR